MSVSSLTVSFALKFFFFRKVVKACDDVLIQKGDSDSENLSVNETKKALHELRSKLELYSAIISLGEDRWVKWQDIDGESTSEGDALVKALVSLGKYDLALRVNFKKKIRNFFYLFFFLMFTVPKSFWHGQQSSQ